MKTPGVQEAIERLVKIMATLRSPGGCPWDAEQTPESLKPYIVEETYEVLQAIDEGDPAEIRTELGDLLLQVVFQARIFEERNQFDLAAVIEAISDKLVRRHPHVFGNVTEQDLEKLSQQWDRIKREEKKSSARSGSASGIPPATLPSLLRARKLLEKQSRSAGPSPDFSEAAALIRKRLAALEQSRRENDGSSMEEYLGDILFAAVRLGCSMNFDAEEALRQKLEHHIRTAEQPRPTGTVERRRK